MSQQESLQARPWTPGPWTTYVCGQIWSGSDPEVEGAPLMGVYKPTGGYTGNAGLNWGDHHQAIVYRETDAKLMALAPEMAEALLAVFDVKHQGDPPDEVLEAAWAVAAKLRAMEAA